jgi:hypothetical protein
MNFVHPLKPSARAGITACLSALLASCAMRPPSDQVVLTQTAGESGAKSASLDVAGSDAAIFAYAERQAAAFKGSMETNRRTRAASDSVALGLSTLTATNEVFGLGTKGIAWLGFGSRTIPDGQKIVNAGGRALAYRDAAALIEEALADYLEAWKSDANPKSGETFPKTYLTPNGVILYQRVMACDYLIERTLAGRLVTAEDLEMARQPMSVGGTTPILPGVDRPREQHVITRSGDNSFSARQAAAAGKKERSIGSTATGGAEAEVDFDTAERPALREFTAKVNALATNPEVPSDRREEAFRMLLQVARESGVAVSGGEPTAAAVLDAYNASRDSRVRQAMRQKLDEWAASASPP